MIKFETESAKLVAIIGGSVAAAMFVGSTFLMAKYPVTAEIVVGIATFILGAVGVTVKEKS